MALNSVPNFTPVLPLHVEHISSNLKTSISRKDDTTRLANLTKPKTASEPNATGLANPLTKALPAMDRKAQLEAWKASKGVSKATTSSCGHVGSSAINTHCQDCATQQIEIKQMLSQAKHHAEANKMPSRPKAKAPTPSCRPSRKHAQDTDKEAIHSVEPTANVTELFEGLQLARLKHNWIIANHEHELKKIDAAITAAAAEKEKFESDRRYAETKAAMIADIEALDEISTPESIFLMQMISGYIELVKELDRHVANTKRPLVLGEPSNLPKLATLQDKVQTCKLTLSNATQNSKQWRELHARQAHVQAMRLHDLLSIVESQINELLRCAKLEQKQMDAAMEAMSKEHSRQLVESSKAESVPALGKPGDKAGLPLQAVQGSSKQPQHRDIAVPRAAIATKHRVPSSHHQAGPGSSSHHHARPTPSSCSHADRVDRQQASVPMTSSRSTAPVMPSAPSVQRANVISQTPYHSMSQSMPVNAPAAAPYPFPLAQQMSMPMPMPLTIPSQFDPTGGGQMMAPYPKAEGMPLVRPTYPVMGGQVMQQFHESRTGMSASGARSATTSKSKRPPPRKDPPAKPTAAPAMHALMPPARNKKKVPGQPEDDGRPKPPKLFGR